MANLQDDERVASGGDAPAPADTSERTVDEWSQVYFPAARSGAPHRDYWKHAAAAALHRWAKYAQDQNEPKRLSQADYEAALNAATKPNEQGAYQPHDAANYGDAK